MVIIFDLKKELIKLPLLFFILFAQQVLYAQQLDWANQIQGSSSVEALVTDSLGNVYFGGSFRNSCDFDPGSSSFTLTSQGFSDGFVCKLDSNGGFLWANGWGSSGFDVNSAIALDDSANAYIVGQFENTVDFDPGTGSTNLTSAGSNDISIVKLNSAGNFVWAKRVGGTSFERATSIVIDVDGNLLITGVFSGTADFDPGPSTFSLSSAGNQDVFILKLSPSGNLIWTKAIGGSALDVSNSIASDDSGDFVITGFYRSTVDFDPGPLSFNLSPVGSSDAFIAKYDSLGNFLWVNAISGPKNEISRSITITQNGDIYAAGNFDSIADFNSSATVFNLSPIGSSDIFVTKLGPQGNFVWAKRIGGPGSDGAYSIKVDQLGLVYTTGYYEDSVDFNPGNGSNFMYALGDLDIFLSTLDSAGNYIWSNSFGGTANDIGDDIWIDKHKNLLSTGSFQDTSFFSVDSTTSTLVSNTTGDVFVQRILCSSAFTFEVSACEQYTWIDNITYFNSTNTPQVVLTNRFGCDSVVTLDLTILSSDTVFQTINACDSLVWIDGKTYYSSTSSPFVALTNAAGCDSIIFLDLTINRKDSVVDSIEACDSLRWLDGITYFSSTQSPSVTFTNSNGCDSIVHLDLTIESVDTALSFSNDTLFVNQANAAYQWLDCNNNFQAIIGENLSYFIPEISGAYACEITLNACTDTTRCEVFNSISEQNPLSRVIVGPNPFENEFSIDLGEIREPVDLRIYNANGKLIYENPRCSSSQLVLATIEWGQGLYFLQLRSGEYQWTMKLVHQ